MTLEELSKLWIAKGPRAKVRKIGGRYGGPGELRGLVGVHEGADVSVVVAHRIEGGFGELRHIYTPAQLEAIEETA